MIPEPFIDLIARNVVEIWFLMAGITPSTCWDPKDVSCVREIGPHRIYEMCGKVPPEMIDDLDLHALNVSFSDFLKNFNKISELKFQPYNMETFSQSGGTFLYASIYN